jgi:hypothetical protein
MYLYDNCTRTVVPNTEEASLEEHKRQKKTTDTAEGKG